jgi:hypothetical protein
MVGLKSSADGKHEGFPIAVFGGEHADVPLEETAGETLATALVEQRFSAILDLSLFRKGQINRFMAPFLETLYRLNREAMHLFVDEADSIARRNHSEKKRGCWAQWKMLSGAAVFAALAALSSPSAQQLLTKMFSLNAKFSVPSASSITKTSTQSMTGSRFTATPS